MLMCSAVMNADSPEARKCDEVHLVVCGRVLVL